MHRRVLPLVCHTPSLVPPSTSPPPLHASALQLTQKAKTSTMKQLDGVLTEKDKVHPACVGGRAH